MRVRTTPANVLRKVFKDTEVRAGLKADRRVVVDLNPEESRILWEDLVSEGIIEDVNLSDANYQLFLTEGNSRFVLRGLIMRFEIDGV